MHRIHPVAHHLDAHHESWCSPDGVVVLLRDRGQGMWRAVVDMVVVADSAAMNGGLVETGDTVLLQAASATDLAAVLAQQERIHVIFET